MYQVSNKQPTQLATPDIIKGGWPFFMIWNLVHTHTQNTLTHTLITHSYTTHNPAEHTHTHTISIVQLYYLSMDLISCLMLLIWSNRLTSNEAIRIINVAVYIPIYHSMPGNHFSRIIKRCQIAYFIAYTAMLHLLTFSELDRCKQMGAFFILLKNPTLPSSHEEIINTTLSSSTFLWYQSFQKSMMANIHQHPTGRTNLLHIISICW